MRQLLHFMAAVAVASLPLPLTEYLDRRYNLTPGITRKAGHLLGCAAACALPFFIPLDQIAMIGLVFCIILILVRRYKLIASLYRIERRSYGEICFPLGVSIAAVLSNSTDSYLTLVLIVGLADTAADIVGSRYGTRYLSIPGGKKSLEGSMAFLAMCGAVLLLMTPGTLSLPMLVLAAMIMTGTEVLSGLGTDNATIPLLGGMFLSIS